jgi:protein-S-isoprenylcysteine O-methyltransferase Ste14
MAQLWATLKSIVYATVFLGLWAWLAWESRALDKYIPVRFPGWLRVPGLVLILAGAALAATTVGMFIAVGHGTPAPFDPPKKLIPRGPYKLMRNPMYVGGISVLIGFGLYGRSMAITLLGLVVFLLAQAFLLLFEEPDLRKRFGKDYELYCQAVPRWIPRFTQPRP